MSLDVVDQQLQVAFIGTKENIEDRADDRDETEQCVDENIEDHAPCEPAIRTQRAGAVDEMEAGRSGHQIARHRQQPDNRVPAEAYAA